MAVDSGDDIHVVLIGRLTASDSSTCRANGVGEQWLDCGPGETYASASGSPATSSCSVSVSCTGSATQAPSQLALHWQPRLSLPLPVSLSLRLHWQ